MPATVKIGSEDVAVPELNGVRALKLVELGNRIREMAPEIVEKRAQFIVDYRAKNFDEYDRVEAKLQFQPIPVTGALGELLRDDDGNVQTVPSPVDRMTDEDWERAGQKIKIPRQPSNQEVGIFILPDVLAKARQPAEQMLGLLIVGNAAAADAEENGTLDQMLAERGKRIMREATLGQIANLLVTVLEITGEEVEGALKGLGERMGNVVSLLGIDPSRLPLIGPADALTEAQPTSSGSASSKGSAASSGGRSKKRSVPAGAPS